MLVNKLTDRLQAALPGVVAGVSIGRADDRATWRIDFAPGASEDDRAAAMALVAAFDPEQPVADDVRAEAARRLLEVAGARDQDHLSLIVVNNLRELSRLQGVLLQGLALSDDQAARLAYLRRVDQDMEAIRAASNILEAAPPADYRDDRHWPPRQS